KEPFFSGTYFPKQGRGKQPGMLQLIPSLANAWSTKQGEITKTIDRLQTYLTEVNTSSQGEEWDESMIRDAFSQYASRFDPDFGGFGKAPKFPSPHNLIFLLRYSKLFGVATGKTMVEKTLHQMRLGGVFDHIGLGFHRYSTDKRWFLPHFEKMLYDQAMISMAFLETYQLTNNENYAKVAREIFTYVLRDMTDKDGGFYSAEDADSEGEEGIFYIWTQEELVEILGEDDGLKLAKTFGFIDGGNFFEEASGHTTGNNIPYFQDDRETLAKNVDMSLDDFNAFIEKSREKLFKVREKRIHPLKDDKILTDWNGLMIAALSQGGQILGDDVYIDAAKNAVNFVLESLRDKNGRLLKRSRLGKAGLQPHLDDYSFMVFGLLNLYEATFDPSYLASALELTEIMIEDFSDKNGGFFIGSKDAEKLMVRAKDSYDGAIPSGNSVAALNLFRLGKITGNTKWTDLGYSTLKAFTDKAKQSPTGFAHMLTAFMFDFKNPKEVVLVGDSNDPETQKIISAIRKNYSPNKVILFKDVSNPDALLQVAPWTKDHVMINGSPTFYICENFACKQPTISLDLAMKYINE
ncbi:MAG: thioredoxin domain-containing protein, partial [Candidatus Marinimicrobia bacterium]|nr:thioredoxin domain-containing protein [Candidatus Neomarinimicrobiota bacterium]